MQERKKASDFPQELLNLFNHDGQGGTGQGRLAEELVEREWVPEPSTRRESRWRRLFSRSAHVTAFDRPSV